MGAITFNQHIKIFEDIAGAHLMVHSFGFGEVFEIEGALKADGNMPKMWIMPVSSTIRLQTVERTFTVLIFDLVKKDESNENEVLSDTEQIMQDVIKVPHTNSAQYGIVGEPQAFPFTERFGDDVSGWRCDVTVETEFDSNGCDIPLVSVVFPGQDGTPITSFGTSGWGRFSGHTAV